MSDTRTQCLCDHEEQRLGGWKYCGHCHEVFISPTPRTDALEQTPLFADRPQSPQCAEALLHARTLERELAEAEKDRDEQVAMLTTFVRGLEYDLHSLRASLERENATFLSIQAQRDKLAEHVRETIKSVEEFAAHPSTNIDHVMPIQLIAEDLKLALAAVEGGE